MVPSTHCPVGRSPSLGPDERFPHLQRNPTKLSCVACPVHGTKLKNCSSELFLINVVGNQQRSCSRRTAPITVASPTGSSTKTKDKRDLRLSYDCCSSPFLHWKIGLSTHTESRCDARRFEGNRRCLRFQTQDLQLQIQDEDLTYV